VVFIVGDFTGVIGDTSDKESERPMLSRETVKENAHTYFTQAAVLLGNSFEKRFNSEWLEKVSFGELGELADQFSLAEFVARDNIKRRLSAGTRVSLRETLYPLMQGYDSIAVMADVELGGVDQRFNLLAGRVLQEHFGQAPQEIVMTEFPIEGLDGRKMSSSWGNTINFTDVPEDMYGKIMHLHDDLIVKYFTIMTRVPLADVHKIQDQLEKGELHPRDAKMRLARAIVALYHNETLAADAERQFVATFQMGEVPEGMQEVAVAPGSALTDVLVTHGVVKSKSECRRLITEEAIQNAETGERITDPAFAVTKPLALKVGKRRFVRITVL